MTKRTLLALLLPLLLLSVAAVGQSSSGNHGGAATAAGTAGQPAVYKASNGIGSSAAYLDATAFAGADPCVADRAAFTAAAQGQLIDGRGFSTTASLASYGATTFPDIKCSIDPIPNTAAGSFLMGPGIYHMQVAFAVPLRIDITGMGWDTNVANAGGANGVGTGATVIAGCKSTDSACGGVNFPAAPGGPIVCWGAQGRSGGCDRGGDNPIFDSPIRRVTVDCNAIAGAIGVQGMSPEEGTGLDTVKIENCYNGGWGLEIAGGITPAANSVTSISGTTVNGSGFTSDLLFNQVQFSAQAGTNYTIASINAAGTVITLDTSYSGAACAPCSLTISNAAAQNSFFYNLYIVHRVALTATAAGGAILMNTGSGSNEGPKFIRMVTAVNSNATQVTDMFRISGCCTAFENIHQESFVNGISFGKDAVASDFSVQNDWVSAVSAGSSSQILISNSFASVNISLYGLKAISPNQPTNIIADQVCSNTILTSSEATMGTYQIGSSCAELITSSHTVASAFFGVKSGSSFSFSGTSAASGTGWFQAASNTIGAAINGIENIRFTSTGMKMASGNAVQVTNGTISGTTDLAYGRTAINTFSIGTTTVNGLGFLQSGSARVTADATYGTGGNVITTTALTTIPGLTWNVPAVAQAYKIDCDLLYTQATAAAANSFAIQAATNAPTRFTGMAQAQITVGPPSTYTSGNGTTSGTGTLTLLTFTPGVAATLYEAHIHALLVNAANANAVNILAATGNIGDLLTIKQDSSCHIEVTAN
jgi:hypothetical protein